MSGTDDHTNSNSRGANQLVHVTTTRLDLQYPDEDVQFYFQQGLAPSTKRTYKSGITKFNKLCAAYNVVDPLPASESLVC